MVAKILILCILATAIVASPIEHDENDEDIPVYTEKVVQGKPTKVGRTVTRIPRFYSKKLSVVPKETHDKIPSERYIQPKQPTLVPKEILKTTQPLRSNPRPVRRTSSYSRNTIANDDYPRLKPALRVGYNAPKPSYAAAPELGVEYALEAPSSNHQPIELMEDYRPRRIIHKNAPEYGSDGNEPELRYAVAPQKIPVTDDGYNSNYQDEHPQPYIFGYEFKDEKGAIQNRKEQGDDYGNKRGSYGYMDEYGIYRQVDYIADAHGFRAVVKTNEPGTENQNPADIEIHSEAAKI